MGGIAIGNLRVRTEGVGADDHLRLKDGDVVKAKSNLGTRTAEFFRGTFGVKDDATVAFRNALRQASNGNVALANRALASAGISTSKPLTMRQVETAMGTLNRLMRQAQPIVQAPLQPVVQVAIALPPAVQGHVDAFANAQGQGMMQMFAKMDALAKLGEASAALASPGELQALQTSVAAHADEMVGMLSGMLNDGNAQPFKNLLGALRAAVVAAGGAPQQLSALDDLDRLAATVKETPLGERLADVRGELARLKGELAKSPDARDAAIQAYKQLGAKVLAAALEQSPDPKGMREAASRLDGRAQFDKDKQPDIASLMSKMPLDKGRLDLLPLKDPAFAQIFPDLARDFTAAYGGLAGVEAHLALTAHDLNADQLRPLLEKGIEEARSHETVTMFATHGVSMTAHSLDYTPTLARAIVLADGQKPLTFDPVVVKGKQVDPPPLKPAVDEASIPTAKTLADALGDVPPTAPDSISANGRTVRFEMPDGRVVALKLMREDETPSKLQREHNAFGLMQDALGGDYAAKPRSFATEDGEHALMRLPKDLLPQEARDKLAGELTRGGLTLKEENGAYLVMSYEVSPKDGAKAQDFFAYVEDAHDDAAFVMGFENSMATMGKMAAKGYFNPSLIQNSYHQGSGNDKRAWVWSPSMLGHGARNTGDEERPLSNAKWSNMRVGGLADPDEFRHLSVLKGEELGKLLGDKHMAKSLEEDAGDGAKVGDRLLGAYLVGRMVHESLVVASRRMVMEGAFDPGTTPQRKQELTQAFKDAVTGGMRAFAAGMTGLPPDQAVALLKKNGLDLDQAVSGMLAERESLYSYTFAEKIREGDAGYFAGIMGVDPKVIEMAPHEDYRSRPFDLVPRQEIMQASDPLDLMAQKTPVGWATVVAVDSQGKLQDFADLGYLDDPYANPKLYEQGGVDGTSLKLEKTQHGAYMIKVELPDGMSLKDYTDGLKPQLHDRQTTGPNNGGYFFHNEQIANHLFASTLIAARTA